MVELGVVAVGRWVWLTFGSGRPNHLANIWAREYCACSRCGPGFVWYFFSRLPFLFSFSLSPGGCLI